MQAAATRMAEYDIAADIAQKSPDAVAKKRLDVLSLKRKEAERAIERAEGNQRAALEAASVAKAELHAAQLKAAAVESMPGAGWNPGAGNEAASAAKQPEQGNTFDAGSKAAENSAADLTAGPRTTPAKPSQPQSEGPLRVSPLPAGWKFEYDNTKGIDFYSAMPQPEGSGVLMFSRWPPPSKPEDIPALVRQIADGFLENAKKSPGVALTSEKYDLKQFVGDHCQGNYAVFQLRNAGVQAMFMMSVNGQTWSGQFTGTPDDWQKALELLKTIKEH